MPLWKKLWLLFTVIWVVVAALQIFTIVAFAEGEIDRAKWVAPTVVGLAVPAVVYVLAWLWNRWRAGQGRRD
jgi:hypothetical protein